MYCCKPKYEEPICLTYLLLYRKIDTKYYDATVKFETIPSSHLDEENLEALGERLEAFIYYFTEERDFDTTWENHI